MGLHRPKVCCALPKVMPHPRPQPQACGFFFADGISSGSSTDVQAALLCLSGKPAKEFVHVDIIEKMNSLGLAKRFPSDAWPPHNALRETATKIRPRVKQGEGKPFVYVDLRR